MNKSAPFPQYLETASIWRRLAARAIDGLVFLFVLLPLSILAIELLNQLSPAFDQFITSNPGMLFGMGMILMAGILYDVLMTRLAGRTLGKIALGLQVVDTRGDRLGWGMAVLRAVVLYVSMALGVIFFYITAVALGIYLFKGVSEHPRFFFERWTHSFVVRRVVEAGVAGGPAAQQSTPFSDLERLHAQGIISDQEYARKKSELGL